MAENEEKTTEEQPKNTITIEDIGPCKKKVTIEIPAEKIKASVDEQYAELRKDALVPGFRKGRAPLRLLEKRFGKETGEQVKLKLLAQASEEAEGHDKLNILGEPNIDYENIELPDEGPLTFDFEVEVKPDFELPSLKDIPVEKPKLDVTDEQVETELTQLCKWQGTWTPRKEDEKVELEDQIIADVLLKIEDVEEEEKHDNSEIMVRKTGFVGGIPVENLDELLVGAKVGNKKETTVEVPQTYFKEEYRGKKVEVKIEVQDIKYLKTEELNETMLANFGVENEGELKDRIRESLQGRMEREVRLNMVDQVYKYMLDNTSFDLPMDVVAYQSANLLRRQYANLMSRGLPREQVTEQMEQLKASSDDEAQQQLRTFFIMDKVAKKLEIEVTDEQLNGQIAALALQQKQRPEKMRQEMQKNGSLEQFRQQICDEMCVEKILESAKITEVEPKKADKKPKKTVKKTAKAKEDKPKKSAKKTEKPAEKKTAKKTAKKTSADKSEPKKKKKTTKKKTE